VKKKSRLLRNHDRINTEGCFFTHSRQNILHVFTIPSRCVSHCVDWTSLAQDRDKWRPFVNMVLNLLESYIART
jgi:hypothetical protein